MSTAAEQILKETLRATLGTSSHTESLLDGRAWKRLSRVIGESAERVQPGNAETVAAGYRYLARFLSAGLRSCVTHDDPDYPVLTRMIDDTAPWGLDHPDCLYLYASLRPDANYRLHGDPGTANVVDIQVNSGHFSSGSVEAVETLSAISRAQLPVDTEGAVDVRIGPERHGSNELNSSPNGRFLQIRQYFGDWGRERPAQLMIEREGAEWPPKRLRPALVGRQLETLTDWIERGGALWESLSERFLAMPPNSIFVHPARESRHGALAGQIYAMGHFQCGLDEAVVLKLKLPNCSHWNISLANRYWETIDYASRQSSLNQQQAQQHDDGHLYCVIAHDDPAIHNWLDPSFHREGTLALRLHEAEAEPTIELNRCKLRELGTMLPDREGQIDPERRTDMLRQRWIAIRRRNRP